MRVPEAFHFQRNTLAPARVQAGSTATRHALQIEGSAEVRGLEGITRDFQGVGARVDDTERLQESQKKLGQPCYGMPIGELFGSARQPPVDMLRIPAEDEIVHIAQERGRGGVHDEEN